jgi:hypothetical protein
MTFSFLSLPHWASIYGEKQGLNVCEERISTLKLNSIIISGFKQSYETVSNESLARTYSPYLGLHTALLYVSL